MSALGDGFRKHPIALSIIGMFTITGLASSFSAAVANNPLPEKMTCTIADTQAKNNGTTLRIEFGVSRDRHSDITIPAEDLQRLGGAPVRFECTAR